MFYAPGAVNVPSFVGSVFNSGIHYLYLYFSSSFITRHLLMLTVLWICFLSSPQDSLKGRLSSSSSAYLIAQLHSVQFHRPSLSNLLRAGQPGSKAGKHGCQYTDRLSLLPLSAVLILTLHFS